METSATTGVEIKADYFFLSFLYALCPVYAFINGVEVKAQWGNQFIPLQPGTYRVEICTHYFFMSRYGMNGIVINIYPGQVVRVSWSAPHITFMQGDIRADLIASS